MKSRYLNQRQLAALNRLGDILLPGAAGLSRFSQTDAITEIDRVLAPVPEADRRDLSMLLTVLGWLPNGALRGLMRVLAGRAAWPSLCQGPMRLLDISLRGLVFTLYYSNQRGLGAKGAEVHDVLAYQVHCQPATGPAKTQGGTQ
ncbi:hypothetical protein QQM79_18940 [Marinobacteraceae bacterium S3BR75-40.1]